jgi:hypothetical protein
MAAPPLFAAVVGLTVAAILAWYYDWRFGVIGALAGGLLLAAGLMGDLISHAGQDDEQARLLSVMAVHADPITAGRLHAMQDEEEANPWHLLVGGGEGILIGGLAGACLVLWRRSLSSSDSSAAPNTLPAPPGHSIEALSRASSWAGAADLHQQAVDRSFAWPMPPLAPVPVAPADAHPARPGSPRERSTGRPA